jgi:hypothetical protein
MSSSKKAAAAAAKKKATNKKKNTPAIILAADEGDLDKVAALIAANPDCVHDRNASQWTALHQAAHAGEEGVIEELLEHKADVNAVCKDGCSPLMYASAQGFTDVIELLFSHGGLVGIVDRDGDNAHKVARNDKTKSLVAKLTLDEKNGVPRVPKVVDADVSDKEEKGEESAEEDEAAEIKPETAKPETPKPEAVKPETVKPEAKPAAKSEATKPEAVKPAATKPETKKPEVKPSATNSEKPDAEVEKVTKAVKAIAVKKGAKK